MSEQKNISPLLDGFTVGNPMSDHDGIRCCPAIKENSEKKYIVKVISVPATQKQMDALLLAGAYKDAAGAMDYYKEQAEEIAEEVEFLRKLSRLGGFLPYDGCQIEPITKRRLGYEVYLLGSYKRSLEKHLHKSPVTHLEAFNMCIDVCSALTVSRQEGSIYMDLKPSNIYISEQKEYRIGDLGFLSLDALNYTTLPTRYRSAYTPPEFDDPMAPLNTTADTYALGMILYQLYNDSQLPSREDILNGTVPTPVNADYELADIIMTAIHNDPVHRWLDPSAMSQALISYMQKNAVNDVPITQHMPLDTSSETVAADAEEPESTQESSAAEPQEFTADTSDNRTDPPSEAAEEEILQPEEMSEELSRMVAKADDLIAHETPEGVVIPEVPESPNPFAFAMEDSEDVDDSGIPLDPIMEEEAESQTKPAKKKKKSNRYVSPEQKKKVRRFFTTLLFIASMSAVALCCILYYNLFYLVPLESLTIHGTSQQITVEISSDADESKLSVVCTDSRGHVHTAPVFNGAATITDLQPSTTYSIELKHEGFHAFSGESTGTFTTEASTRIVSLTAANGPEDGSFVLDFTVDGEEPDEWYVICSADGNSFQTDSFSGHSVTIKHLTVGKIYTFTVHAKDGMPLSGMTSIECMASRMILAENLTVSTENGNDMTIRWNSPGDVVVESWDVRCYNNQEFDVQFTVKDPEVTIAGINLAQGYTVEVTAAGMTQPARISITKNPITIEQFTVETPEKHPLDKLAISWEFSGNAPKDGWLLLYTIDGAATANVILCDDPHAEISPRVPGATYRFTLQSANSTSVINSTHRYESPEVESFEQHGLSASNVTAQLLKTPEHKNWRYETIHDNAFSDTFAVGESISVVLRADSPFYLPGNETWITYVFRDTHGNVIPDMAAEEKTYWKNIWSGGDAKTGELDVPIAPENPGNYVLEIYIDGMIMAQVPLTIR